jgi:hypothetical protein
LGANRSAINDKLSSPPLKKGNSCRRAWSP